MIVFQFLVRGWCDVMCITHDMYTFQTTMQYICVYQRDNAMIVYSEYHVHMDSRCLYVTSIL